MVMDLDIRTVGDLPDTLPIFMLPDIPLTINTLLIILPYSVGLAIVGLLESMMTATIVDDYTQTKSDKNRECKGQGVANICAGFLGGMAGCAMIGQSVINMKSGGRGRLSTFIAGILLLILVVFLSDWVAKIPMAALVAVMIMVSISTFSWDSIRKLRVYPLSANLVMLTTVIVVVFTHNLAYGVIAGVLLAALFFANKIARFLWVKSRFDDETNTMTYSVIGQLFFASSDRFMSYFDNDESFDNAIIDLTKANLWDITGVNALDKAVLKLRQKGTTVKVIGISKASANIVDKFGEYDRPFSE